SFSLIAKKHIEYIRKLKLAEVQELDELGITSYTPHLKYNLILHPWIYIYHKLLQNKLNSLTEDLRDKLSIYMDWWRSHYEQLIAVDVCDSDRLSELAVELLNDADKVIVPSNFCVEVCKCSGVQKPVYRVQHGLDVEWYSMPNQWETSPVKTINPALIELYLYKIRKNKKLMLFWLWHSPDRKGWPEAKQLYEKLSRERKDVVLVLKTVNPNSVQFQEVMHLGAVQVYGWLSEYEKMCLYDLSDLTLMFSRGGGFEVNALESLARIVPVVTSDWGSWTDYVPSFLRVKTGERVQPLPGNAIHVGYGYKVDVESALNKVHDILDNIEEYRAKLKEYKLKLSEEYCWDRVAERLMEVVS
ncbi:MAG: hypothetical protein MRT15_11325, partial [archaeon YNP-LCB-003-016]|uniref:hypothetical protein n=1 Tax=Candidatus Culexarchaeum yellowstonense TaxID=2928963 RepID=UPI0026EF78AE